jgi:predicted nucleotidyltransferase
MGFQLNNGQRVSIKYHSIFNFPLRKEEVKTWEVGKKYAKRGDKEKIQEKNNFVFVKGKEKTISIRQQNEKISEEKLTLALAAAADIARIPTVLLVALTGSLAMKNATKDSDIDMMIVTQENTVWTTRLAVYVLLKLKNWKIRTPGNKNEKDKLCLNMWMDESSLAIHEQNIYSAHEVVQIVPLINKNKIYSKVLFWRLLPN